jgi:hypothetical protein
MERGPSDRGPYSTLDHAYTALPCVPRDQRRRRYLESTMRCTLGRRCAALSDDDVLHSRTTMRCTLGRRCAALSDSSSLRSPAYAAGTTLCLLSLSAAVYIRQHTHPASHLSRRRQCTGLMVTAALQQRHCSGLIRRAQGYRPHVHAHMARHLPLLPSTLSTTCTRAPCRSSHRPSPPAVDALDSIIIHCGAQYNRTSTLSTRIRLAHASAQAGPSIKVPATPRSPPQGRVTGCTAAAAANANMAHESVARTTCQRPVWTKLYRFLGTGSCIGTGVLVAV